MTFEMDKYK
jgi:uncharacterized OB-fold protein